VVQVQARPHCGCGPSTSTVGHMARVPMKTRNFRVSDSTWLDAVATAEAAGESLAAELRGFLEWYTRQPRARPPHRPDVAVSRQDMPISA
jgi:hypothetical protein